MDKVFVLDADQRSALAAVRSLGSKGISVLTGDTSMRTLAGASRFCSGKIGYPSPEHQPDHFITTLQSAVEQYGIDVLLPMTDVTTYLLLKHRDAFPRTALPFPPFQAYDLLSDKYRLFQIAEQLGIPCPTTYYVNNPADIEQLLNRITFPAVLKPSRSRILENGKWTFTSVKIVNSISELKDTVARYAFFQHHPFLIQSYVHGTGQGVFALYAHGEPSAFFAHKRIREKPPSGGVSVLSESVPVRPDMQTIATKLLDHAGWHGVAMVEFKVAADGTPYLMEVNARFWGSLQLAIDADVDFPYLLYQLATNNLPPERINGYRIGVRTRWLLGDLDRLYLLLKAPRDSLAFTERCRAMLEFLKLFEANTRYEVNRWNDPRPFLFELSRYFRELLR